MSKRAHIHRHYEPRVQPERESFDILDWGSASAQEARFAVLARLMRELSPISDCRLPIADCERRISACGGDADGASPNSKIENRKSEIPPLPLRVLDAGCGLADLRAYLRNNGFAVDGIAAPNSKIENRHSKIPVPLSYTGVDITPGILAEAQRRQPDATLLLADLFEEEPFPARSFDVVFASGLFNLDLGNNAAFIRTGIPRLFALAERLLVVNFLHVRTPHKHGHCHYTHPEELLEEFRPLAARSEVIADYLPNDFTLVLWR